MLIYCPECENACSNAATSCPKCGHPLKAPVAEPIDAPLHEIQQAPQRLWSPGVAAVLSFFIPGLGQLYKGQFLNGFAWLLMVVFGYFLFVIPGLVLHLCCIAGAMMGDPYKKR